MFFFQSVDGNGGIGLAGFPFFMEETFVGYLEKWNREEMFICKRVLLLCIVII